MRYKVSIKQNISIQLIWFKYDPELFYSGKVVDREHQVEVTCSETFELLSEHQQQSFDGNKTKHSYYKSEWFVLLVVSFLGKYSDCPLLQTHQVYSKRGSILNITKNSYIKSHYSGKNISVTSSYKYFAVLRTITSGTYSNLCNKRSFCRYFILVSNSSAGTLWSSFSACFSARIHCVVCCGFLQDHLE